MKIFAFLVCFVVFSIYETFGYDYTYPLMKSFYEGNIWKYRIAVISNFDRRSKVGKNRWRTILKKGWLTVHKLGCNVTVKQLKWDKKVVKMYSNISSNGRAMEMSELVEKNGKLYTCDKGTGIVYELVNGYSELRKYATIDRFHFDFKCKWMTVKNDHLYVGAEFRDEFIRNKNQVPTIQLARIVNKEIMFREDWINSVYFRRYYNGFPKSGYLTIEAANWSERQNKWFVLVRTGDNKADSLVEDETKRVNRLFMSDKEICEANQDFFNRTIGPLKYNGRFTSFKFLPDSDDNFFVALKVEVVGRHFATYMEAYDINGKMLMKPRKIADEQYEGLEFI